MYSSSTILNKETNLYSSSQKLFINKIRSQINIDDLNKKIEKLKKLKVLILGETIIDKYVFCEALGKSRKRTPFSSKRLKRANLFRRCNSCSKKFSRFL